MDLVWILGGTAGAWRSAPIGGHYLSLGTLHFSHVFVVRHWTDRSPSGSSWNTFSSEHIEYF
jgi:hypothetical protein